MISTPQLLGQSIELGIGPEESLTNPALSIDLLDLGHPQCVDEVAGDDSGRDQQIGVRGSADRVQRQRVRGVDRPVLGDLRERFLEHAVVGEMGEDHVGADQARDEDGISPGAGVLGGMMAEQPQASRGLPDENEIEDGDLSLIV